jgi:hypothetical protein
MKCKLIGFLCLWAVYAAQAQFTAGKIVVSQVGDGTNTLSTGTFPVSLLEFDISTVNQATPSNTVSLNNTTAGSRITTGGTTAQSGQISLSSDGKYLISVGYDHPTAVATPASTTVNKVIARINGTGTVDYTTNFPTANGTARSVVSDDGTRFWSSINNVGYEIFRQTTTPTQVVTGTPRVLNIYNGQLFYYNSFGNILKTNTALPTGSSTTTNAVILSAALNSNGFVFFDLDPNTGWDNTGFDVLYLTNSNTGLEKYYYDTATSSWLPVHSQYHLTVTITNGGSGYTSPPTVKIGTDWAANTAYTVGQQVLGTSGVGLGRLYTVTVAGTSGTTSPVHTTGTATNGTVTFSHAAASPNAAATAIVTDGVVTGVTITTQQNGYTSGATPTVTFSGGGGSGATATASVPQSSNVFNGGANGSLAQLTGKLIIGVPTLFAITGNGTTAANKLIKIVDNSGRTGTMTNVLSPTTVLATAAANYAFRGVAFSTETPQITVSPTTLSGFSTNQGTASTTQTYTVRGAYLGANLSIAAPTGYEISTTSGSGFASSLTLTPNSGTVPLTTIYVRLASTAAAGTPSGNITHTSTDATTQNVAVSGTVITGATPTINITGTPLSAFITNEGTASAEQNYSVSGSNLTANIVLTAPTGFEISASSGSGFGSSLTLTQSSGSVSATPIYVRLIGTSAGTPSGNITHTSTGVTTQNVAVSGTVNTVSTPAINIMGTPLSAFTTFEGTPSVSQSYSVSGTNLTANISVTAPTGFEISTSSGSGFGSSLTLTQSSGSVSATPIYVRLIGTSAGTPSGNITHTSTGATTQNVAVSGTVNALPLITITGSTTAFSTFVGTPSANQTYTVSGSNLTADIALTAPTGFEISTSASSGFAGSLTLTQTGGSVSTTTIYVRLIGTSAGTPSGNITHTSTGATMKNVAVSGTVSTSVTSFSKGNIAVLRIGDGSTTLGSTATNVNILEFTTQGNPTGLSFALPTSGATKFVLGGNVGGTATQEGQLTLSGDNRFITAVGYDADLGAAQTGTLSMTASTKVIARIGYDAALDLTTKIPTSNGFNGNYVRNVATNDGNIFWVTTNTIARQISYGTTSSATFTGGGAYRSIQVFAGTRYYVNFQIPGYIDGTPSAVNLATDASPATQFSAAAASQGLYLVDADPSVSFNGTGYDLMYIPDLTNGIKKWYFNGSVWVFAGNINPTSLTGVTGGFYAISVKMVSGKPEIYAIKGAAVNNNIMKIIDNAGRTGSWETVAPTTTTIASAGSNYMFRGLAFSPVDVPRITVTPTSLSGFVTYQNTPSATQTYTVSGVNLLADISITAPTGYEISLSASSGFGSSLTIPQTDGTAAATTVYVRLTATTIGTPAGNIVHTTTNGATTNVAVTGTVNAIPTITITGTPLTPFSTVVGTPSATQNYTVSGTNLIDNIVLTAPTGFEISTNAGSGFGASVTLTPISGSVTAMPIYVRLTGTSVNTPSGNITHTSTDATTQNVAVNGTVIANDGILVIETPIAAFTTTQATPSVSRAYKVGGTNLTADIVITAPAEFEISLSSTTGFGNSLTLTQSGGSVPLTTIYVRLTGASVGTPSGNITHTSTGKTQQDVAVSGTVLTRPVITISSTSLTGFTTSEGAPSATQSFTVSGTDLITNLILTAPTGFEISTASGSGFSGSLTLTPVSGTVSTTTIYVRLTGTTISSPSGNIALTTTGAITQNVAVSGIVNPKPLITLSASSLTAFTTREGTPSTTQTYTVTGVNLTADIVLTAPSGFEISTASGGGFSGTLTLPQSGGNVSVTPIYARLTGVASGSPSGNITHTTTDGVTKTVAVTGTVSVYKEIIVSATTLTVFTTFVGTPSVSQSFTVEGVNLTNDISINAPTGFEISLASGSGYGSSLTLTQTGGSVANTTIYARLTGASVSTPSGNIALTSTGTDPKNVAVTGTVNAIPVITTSVASLTAFSTTLGVQSAVQNYTVSGSNLLENIVLTAPTGFIISKSADGIFTTSLSLSPVSGSVATTTIYVRINEAVVGTPSGNITHTTNGATSQNVAVSGTVAVSTGATVYYVSPTGDNNNNGLSPSTPFRTLSKFSFSNNTLLVPGVVVYVMDGIYGATNLAGTSTNNGVLEIAKSGTATNPIKFTNYPGHTPIVQFNGWNGILIKASYIEINGIKVRGNSSVLTLSEAQAQPGSCGNTGSVQSKFQGNGINLDGRAGASASPPIGVTIKNCEVYECSGGGIVTSEGDYVTIENNIVYNCAWYSVYANSGISVFHGYNSDNNTTTYKHIIRNNIAYGNDQKVGTSSCSFTDGNGIIIDDFRNTQSSSTIQNQLYTGKILVENNIVYNNGGRGIHAYLADNVKIINNVSYQNSFASTANGNEGEITIVSSNNARVYNNVMVARTGKKLSTVSSSTGLQEGNNLMYNSGTFAYFNGTDIMADPKFVNAAGFDFRLQSTSPGIDAGNNTTGLFATKDFVNTNRPFNSKVDIGAYEFTGTVPSVTKYTEGNIVVLRVGDGSTTLGANSAPVNILEYSTAGTASGLNIALPNSASTNFVLGGVDNTLEGQLTLSGDGRYLSAVGYNITTGQSNGASSEKIVARIDHTAHVDLTTKIPTSSGFSGNTLKNAVTENGSSFFVTAGTAATARQVNFTASTSATFSGGGGYNTIQRFGGISYYINFQVPGFINSSGTATAFTNSASSSLTFNGAGTNVSQSLYLLDADASVSFNGTGYDLLYTSDITNGIRKWYFDGTGWMYAGVVNPASTPSVSGGFYSIVAKMVDGKPELYAVKGAASNNVVMKIVDESGRTGNWTSTAPIATSLFAAGSNNMFRGISFAPVNKPENQLIASVSVDNTIICTGSDAVFNITGTSGATVTYKMNTGANTDVVLTGGSATVTITGVTANQTLNLVSITNGTTTQTLTSSTLISVTTPSVGGTISGGSTPVCAGTNSTALTLSGHTGTILRWQSSTDNFATAGTNINQLSTAYIATNLSATTTYRAVIQSGTCAVANSTSATVTVNPLPTITGTLSVNIGATTTLTGSGTAATTNPWVSATTSIATVDNAGVVTGVAAGTSVITYTNDRGCRQTVTVTVTVNSSVRLSLKVYLEGPYKSTTSLMNNDLRALATFPTTSPYGGTETINPSVLSVSTNDAIVDWVFVELTTSGGTVYTRSALLQADGDIVDTDGVSPLSFSQAGAGSYTITIKHRSHLKIKTSGAVLIESSGTTLNFTNGSVPISGVLKTLSAGIYGLYTGDLNQDGNINTEDRTAAWTARNLKGYNQNDCSMDGSVDATDRSIIWNNRNLSSGF